MAEQKSHTNRFTHKAAYRIVNIVVNVKLERPIDLKLISKKYSDVKFNLNKFPGIQIRLSQPKSVILLFKNGKMVITGLKKVANIQEVIDIVVNRLTKIDIDVAEKPIHEIVNIVTSINYGKTINLDKAAIQLHTAVYEPEVFPGIIYRTSEPYKCAYLIFSSGKTIMTGLTQENQIAPSIKYLGVKLKNYSII